MKPIVIVGSSNTDMVIRSARIPVPGETILGGTFFMNPGGKGANQAVAAARLGGQVTFIAKTGNDIFGKEAAAHFSKEGIDVSFLLSDAEYPSGVALITVDDKGENTIVVAQGSNAQLLASDISKASEIIQSASFILMQLEIPMETVEHASNLAFAKNIPVVLNPAPGRSLPASLLEKISIITPNESEAEILTGIKVSDDKSAEKAAVKLQQLGVKTVIITRGSEGAAVLEGDRFTLIASPVVKAVDTTAAGDVFNGALVVAMAEGHDLLQSTKIACEAASISVTRLGAQSSAPYRKEIQSLKIK